MKLRSKQDNVTIKVIIILILSMLALPVFSKITEVTVFTDRALITREENSDTVIGLQEIVFENIPPGTDLSTIRAKGFTEKDGGLKILDIQTKKNYVTNYNEGEVATLREQIKQLDQEIKKNNAELDRLAKQKSMLEIFMKNSQITNSDDLSKGSFSIEQWQKAYSYYIEQTAHIDGLVFGLEEANQMLYKDRSVLNSKLSGYSQVESYYTLDVIVSYEMKKAAKAKILLNYITPNAGWYSLYDCRVSLDEKELLMGYYAKVYQNTGEDWNDVNLILSTARPDLSGVVPSLSPWLLTYYEITYSEPSYEYNLAKDYRSREADGFAEADEYFYDDAIVKTELEKTVYKEDKNIASVDAAGLNVQYGIVKKSTIPSNNEEIKVTVASEIPLKTDFEWEVVPRLDTNAFLKGKIKNDTDFTFLPGEMALFVDENFVGNSHIELVNSTQEFELSLGRDPRLTSEFKLVDTVNGKKLKKTTEKRTYEITVYNNAKEDITVNIKDILPKSSYPKKIIVKIVKVEPEPTEIEYESIYNWELTIKKGEKVTIFETWEVEYPQDIVIQGL